MKINVCVLFGGNSSEHEVSLISANSVINNIDENKYNVIKVGITKGGKWLLANDVLGFDSHVCDYPSASVDFGRKEIIVNKKDSVVTIPVDVFFPVLHGRFGEDGTIQGLFEMAGVSYVGCDYETSAVCMDKSVTKAVLNSFGIRQAKAIILRKDEYANDRTLVADRVIKELNYPVFVKPARSGSSVGVSRVVDESKLKEALDKAFNEDKKVLIEEEIVGKELEVAVLEEKGKYIVSKPAEIDPGCEFYDYDAKYNTSTSSFYIPARIPQDKIEEVMEKALKIFKILECRNLSRVDFFYSNSGEVIFNEINTMPGFTSISMYPKLMQNEGMSYKELVDRLIQSSIG